MITEGWLFDFDNCQDDGNVLDGILSNADSGSNRFVSSSGFSRDTPFAKTRFRGNVDRMYRSSRGGDGRYWTTTRDTSFFGPNAHDPEATGVDYAVTDSSGIATFDVRDARTTFFYFDPVQKKSAGSFSISSELTRG